MWLAPRQQQITCSPKEQRNTATNNCESTHLANLGEGTRSAKLNCPLGEQRKTGPLLALLSHPERKVCFRTRLYTHLAG